MNKEWNKNKLLQFPKWPDHCNRPRLHFTHRFSLPMTEQRLNACRISRDHGRETSNRLAAAAMDVSLRAGGGLSKKLTPP
ncbi:MAG TPA: hypothetical protein PK752_09840 [Accumulibacter sp.]|uniref:hypothetical protein n=1 Tax=Accumulibacter sp. TaxID=2053492 RepID=UPI002C981F83|nr:hypothetical protein [Accumulibacter sp.]HRD88540.1 hypothetical protein [Accumulibacter sp.]